MSDLDALQNRVSALEAQFERLLEGQSAGFARIENLIRNEINDIKVEQIKDLRESNTRLGDDQRRLWDRQVAAELRENQRIGGDRKIGSIWHFLSAGLGGFVTWVATYLSFGGRPPHP